MGARLAYPDNWSLYEEPRTMTDAPKIVLPSGTRTGHGKLSGESGFRQKIGEGYEVFTVLNNVYFSATLNDADEMVYRPLTAPPEGLA